MAENDLISNLKKFGLSENESKAYVGLVFLQEPSVRELHEFTKIPRAKLYEVLDNLVGKRYAEILHGTPAHYKPTDPEDLIQMLREDYEKTAIEISQAFEEMDIHVLNESDEEFVSVQYLRSDWTVRKRMNELFDKTHRNLIIFSRSPDILKDIESDLISIQKRVDIIILTDKSEGYENISLPITVYHENIRPLLKVLEESHITDQNCAIISDSGTILAIRKSDSKTEGHYISQTMVDFLYKTIYYFVSNAESIELPEELLIDYKPNPEKPSEKRAGVTFGSLKSDRADGRRAAAGYKTNDVTCVSCKVKSKIKEAKDNLKQNKTRKNSEK